MFIEKLWEENPELVIKAVKKIWDVRGNRGDTLEFEKMNKGELVFYKHGRYSYYSHSIIIRDFEVYDNKINSNVNIDWMKFMKSVFGDKYLYHYIAYRNEKLDRFMAEYEDNYNNETKKVLAEIGMEKYKDELNQTK